MNQKQKAAEMINQWRDVPVSQIKPFGSGHYNDVYEFESNGKEYVLRIAPGDDFPKLFYELIKYAFIRLARGGSQSTARMHVEQCRALMGNIP